MGQILGTKATRRRTRLAIVVVIAVLAVVGFGGYFVLTVIKPRPKLDFASRAPTIGWVGEELTFVVLENYIPIGGLKSDGSTVYLEGSQGITVEVDGVKKITGSPSSVTFTFGEPGTYVLRARKEGFGGASLTVKIIGTDDIKIYSLAVCPRKVQVWQPTEIFVEAIIKGGLLRRGDTITYTIPLKINGGLEAIGEVTFDSSSNVEALVFSVKRPKPGTYSVEVGGYQETLRVVENKVTRPYEILKSRIVQYPVYYHYAVSMIKNVGDKCVWLNQVACIVRNEEGEILTSDCFPGGWLRAGEVLPICLGFFEQWTATKCEFLVDWGDLNDCGYVPPPPVAKTPFEIKTSALGKGEWGPVIYGVVQNTSDATKTARIEAVFYNIYGEIVFKHTVWVEVPPGDVKQFEIPSWTEYWGELNQRDEETMKFIVNLPLDLEVASYELWVHCF